ncbi:helix-turn-helix transcriptional regulator [Microbacterium timonense]|uniref:helix-turn-helix transcriptional regulator n=1 Tax=Microbacterium timonense TaxID=2086576 RepID=UPI001F2322DB|nr:LuxR C-terminal-related transcriptional regulator [Microbacterium timonense]
MNVEGWQQIEVRPLDSADARRLLLSQDANLPPRLRARVLEEARGNPLALVELARSTADSLGADSVMSTLPLTQRLGSLFAQRILDLPAYARKAILIIALDGRERMRDVVALGVEVDALAPAEAEGLLAVDTHTMAVRFPHPLIRAAVVQQASAAERREAHLRIADAVTDPDRRAWHIAAAATGPNEEVATALENVGRRSLRRGDAGTAVSALIRAARLSPERADESRRLAEAAYLGADITGELEYASRLLSEARRAHPAAGTSLHATAAAAYMTVNGDGDVDSAYRVLVRAIESGTHDWSPENTELVEAVTSLLLLCWWAGKPEYWASLHRAVDRFGEHVPELLFIESRAFPDTVRLGAPVRARLAELIEEQADEHDPNRIIRVNTSSVYLDLLGGCRSGAWRLIEDGRSGGAVRSSLGAYMHLCLDDFGTGRWDEQHQLAEEGLAVCRDHGYAFIAWYFVFHRALLAAVRGDPADAFRWASELTAITSARNALGAERFGHHARTLAAIAQNDWDAAFRYAERLSPAGELAPYTPHALWVAFDLVEAAMRTGRPAAARAHVRAMVANAVSEISPRMAMMTFGAQALVAEGAEPDRLFAAAEAVPGGDHWPFDLARVRLAYGEWLRRNAESVRAREVLHRALDAFDMLGARSWSERTRENLRAARDPEARNGLGSQALTAQERSIVELAAQGLSNKEIGVKLFLSPRTVSGHLYRAFPKLGVTSRAALRDVLSTTTEENAA